MCWFGQSHWKNKTNENNQDCFDVWQLNKLYNQNQSQKILYLNEIKIY